MFNSWPTIGFVVSILIFLRTACFVIASLVSLFRNFLHEPLSTESCKVPDAISAFLGVGHIVKLSRHSNKGQLVCKHHQQLFGDYSSMNKISKRFRTVICLYYLIDCKESSKNVKIIILLILT